MADRFQQTNFSVTVAGGGVASFGVTIPANIVNIAKIKVVPSVSTAQSEFMICKSNSYAPSTIVYRTDIFTGPLIDPIEDTGAIKIERNQGFVCAYEDVNLSLQLYIYIKNLDANPVTYNGIIWVDAEYSHSTTGIVVGVPDGLEGKAYASNLNITSGVTARKNNATIDSAEFRAIFVANGVTPNPYYDLRTVPEGGTLVHNGITQFVVTGITATSDGAQFLFLSANPGRWYYAWRLHNSVGWSNWTDGNQYPIRVTKYVDTRDLNSPDIGPPSDWDLFIEDGPASNTVVVTATRPNTNGDIINFLVVQVKDGSTGAWTTLLNGPDVDNIKWDGRTVPLGLSGGMNSLIDPTSGGFGTAARGDLVLLDVRGATWTEAYCQWATIKYISGNTIYIDGFFRPKALSDLRILIIKPPWAWTSGGYLGGYAGKGWWPQKKSDEGMFIGDTGTKEFKTTPIVIPSTITNPEARVWFENDYSRADDSLHHSTGLIGLPTQKLWTKFDDVRWFVPLYGEPTQATVAFDSNGSALINPVTPRSADGNGGNLFGVRGHFSVYPDSNGILLLRAKWTNVTIPVYVSAPPSGLEDTREGTSLILCQLSPWSNWYGLIMWSVVWGNYRNQSDIRLSQGDHYGNEYLTPIALATGAVPAYLDVARPAAGYTLEIRVGFSSSTSPLSFPNMALTTCEYNLNSGGWIAIPNINLGKGIAYYDAAIEGVVPTVGIIEPFHGANGNLSGWTAKLTEFEVIQGIIRQFRLQSVR